MRFRVYARCVVRMFLPQPVILGTETVAPTLSASLNASSNHSWHSSSKLDLTLATALRGIVTLLGKFIKSQKVSSDQLNFKTNDLVLFFKTI